MIVKQDLLFSYNLNFIEIFTQFRLMFSIFLEPTSVM